MGRHAYCILAHNDIHLLNTLLQCVDDVRNDIFIHLDKKSSLIEADIYHPKNSILYFTERTDVRWGDISMVKAELLLFNKVLNINNISGGVQCNSLNIRSRFTDKVSRLYSRNY